MPVYRRDFLAGSVATLALAAGLGRWDLGDDGQLVTGSIQGMTPPDENPSSQLAERYLDRGAIRRQTVAPPGLIGAILSPTLGAPARAVADPASGASRFSIVLTGPLPPSSHLILIPRDELSGIDEDLYALPPLPGGHDLIRARLRQAAQRLDGTAATGPGLPSWEWEWQRLVRQDTNWAQAVTRQLDRIALDSDEDCRAAIRRIVAKVADYVRQPSRPRMMLTCSSWQRLGKAEAWTAKAAGDLAPGLYALALVTADGTLLDVQLNAVYRPSTSADDLSFILASDLQWGTIPEVASANLKFISLLNAAAELPEAPEFVILSGDVVDCKFGSAGTLRSQLLGGANDYPRDYLQAWLALAGSRLPLYIVPGNHDGYRFEDPLGRTRSDGLLLFEDTFGPSYAAFDRPPFRFILANSYDLPKAFRTSRRSEQSNVLEKISDKLNTLNWGGGIGAAQLRWLRAQLGLDGAAPNTLIPILVCHHDPRGAFPALKPPKSPAVAWDRRRHMPISTPATDAAMMDLRLPPHSADTEEVHAGSYTPLRRYDSTLRNGDWFEVGLGGSMPSFLGFPGWSRYQQEWHIDLMYDGRWNRVTPQPPAADLLASPDAILRTMIEGKVRAVFKGHDNRFARSHMEAGDSIFGQRAEDALLSLGADAGQLSPLRLSAPMSVFHNADIGDIDSDGHGMLWVRAQGQELTVLEVDLVW